MQITEHLVFVNQSGVTVINDDLESHLSLLPHQKVYFLSVLVVGMAFAEVALHLC